MLHRPDIASPSTLFRLLVLLGSPVIFLGAELGLRGPAVAIAEEQAGQASKGVAVPIDSAPPRVNPLFPDFGYLPAPDDYKGPVFKLSQDYPKQIPHEIPAFFSKLPHAPFSTDFEKGGWRDYMMAVRDYCFEGNTAVDFRVELNKRRKWYHMPWQHPGPAGREGVHGLTKEAQVNIGQLAETQSASGSTYAVGFFNSFGGFAIGRVWANHSDPDPSYTSVPDGGKGFPDGTVIFKLLFVDNDPASVPSLANPQQWNAYVTTTYSSESRTFKNVSLIQMDIAIKDQRAQPTGWLFGTFQYNGQLGAADWTNLMPLGIMWGNDPADTENTYTQFIPGGLSPTSPPHTPMTQTKINPNLKEASINPNTKEVPPTHLGWNGRLNGPVDNVLSSCMSCHMTAEVPALSPINPTFQGLWDVTKLAQPPLGSPVNQPPPPGFTGVWSGGWMRWFQNIKCGQPFDGKGNPWTQEAAKSTDFSLQLSIGLTNFTEWQALSGIYASAYKVTGTTSALNVGPAAQGRTPSKIPRARGHTVFPITRDPIPPKR